MKMLITGGAGFIGSNFVHYINQTRPEDSICIYDKLTYAGNLDNVKSIIDNPNVTFIKEDICNKQTLLNTIKSQQIDTIVHFAAESHVDRSIEDPETFIKTNVFGTYTILECLREFPEIRLHHVSTDEVFGSLPIDKPKLKFTESTPYDPQSPYAASKAAADHLVRSYVNTYKIKATISNCSNNFGPYCHIEKLIPLIITRALFNEQIPVYGSGMQIRDWIHVEDHCRGIDLILKKGKIGETYLLGGDGERPNIFIVKEILKILGKPESLISYVEDRKGHDPRYAVDYSKAKKELGYNPQKSIEERLKDTVNWYVNNKSWWEKNKKDAHAIASKYLQKEIKK